MTSQHNEMSSQHGDSHQRQTPADQLCISPSSPPPLCSYHKIVLSFSIPDRQLFVQIRILPSTSKKIKKPLIVHGLLSLETNVDVGHDPESGPENRGTDPGIRIRRKRYGYGTLLFVFFFNIYNVPSFVSFAWTCSLLAFLISNILIVRNFVNSNTKSIMDLS
jgi:hypothetical protein